MNVKTRIRLGLVFAVAVAIELFCRTGIIPHSVMIPPSEMVVELVSILRRGEMVADIASTFTNVAMATLIFIVLGFVAGLAIHAVPGLRTAVEPLLASYYSVPTFMFYPV